jgi:hypothetical protein
MSFKPPKKIHERSAEMSGTIMDEELPSNRIVDGVIVNKDGSMGLAFRVAAPLLTTVSASTRLDLHSQLRTLINGMPENFDLQVIWQQDHRPDRVLKALDQLKPQKDALVAYTAEQVEQFRSRLSSGSLRFFEVIIVITRKCSVNEDDAFKRAWSDVKARAKEESWGFESKAIEWMKLKWLPSSFFAQYTEEEFAEARKDLIDAAAHMSQSLTTMGLAPVFLKENASIELYYKYWSPASYDSGCRARKFDPLEDLPLTDYYVTSTMSDEGATFILDGMHHAIMTMRNPPEQLQFVQWEKILLYRGFTNLRLVVNCRRGNMEKRKRKLNRKLSMFQYRLRKERSLGPVIQDIQAELDEIGRDVEKAWLGSVTIHLWGKTANDVKDSVERLKRAAAEFEGLDLVNEVNASWAYWRAFQPFWTRDHDAFRTYEFTTSQIVCLMPIIGEETCLERPVGALFETASQSIYNFDPFDEQQFSNYNMLVIGGSGSGKSFVMQQMLLQLYRARKVDETRTEEARVVVVDLGGSFRKLCECISGSFIDMDINSSENCMNPLYFNLESGKEPEPDEINARLFFLEKLMMEGDRRLPRESMAVVEEVLMDLIHKSEGREFQLDALMALLQKHSGGRDMAKLLSVWVTGRYKKLFNGRNSASLGNAFTVFDLTRVVENKDVLPVMFASIVSFVIEMGKQYPGQRKYLIFDEAWRVLKDPVMGAFIETCYRALRKMGFCVISISQSIEEFVSSGSKTAITGNISHQIILRQNSLESAKELAHEFAFNDAEFGLIQTLTTVKGQYAQAMVRHNLSTGRTRSHIVVCRPTPVSYAMATTNANDKREFERIFGEVKDYAKAVYEFARLHPNGVSEAEAAAAAKVTKSTK